MNIRRALLALGIAGLMVFALSGCFVITADSPSQLNTIGDVVVHTEACLSSTTSTDPCGSNHGNSDSDFNDGGSGNPDGQFLLAYRVPDGYGAPTQVTSTSGTPQLVLNASSDYTSQLTSLAPPPAGEHWVGFMSDPQSTPASNTAYVFDTHFTRPPAQNGVPASAPFQYLTVTGAREINSGFLATRPLNCGASFHELTGNQTTDPMNGTFPIDGTTCIDSPTVANTATSLPADTVLFTRDLAIAPGSATANRNSTVNVPFKLNSVGPADPSEVFTLGSSISGLSGASAAPVNSTFNPPANSSTVQNVAVHLPANAKAGTYQVPFSATLANGQTRTATGSVTVLPDATGPKLKISFPKLRLAKGSKGFKITVTCSEDCSLLATLNATPNALKAAKLVKLGSAKATLQAAGRKTLTIKLTHSGKSKLKALAKNHKSLKGTLTIMATDGLGNKTKTSKHVTLK